ncbi:MAG: hypothetical protein AB7P00_18995 [Sandaracinaceae bacterium]
MVLVAPLVVLGVPLVIVLVIVVGLAVRVVVRRSVRVRMRVGVLAAAGVRRGGVVGRASAATRDQREPEEQDRECV